MSGTWAAARHWNSDEWTCEHAYKAEKLAFSGSACEIGALNSHFLHAAGRLPPLVPCRRRAPSKDRWELGNVEWRHHFCCKRKLRV